MTLVKLNLLILIEKQNWKDLELNLSSGGFVVVVSDPIVKDQQLPAAHHDSEEYENAEEVTEEIETEDFGNSEHLLEKDETRS